MEGENTASSTQRDQNIYFIFEQQDTKLIINAQTDNILYSTIF